VIFTDILEYFFTFEAISDHGQLVYNAKVATRDALLARILDAADHIRNSQLKLLRATRAVHNRAAACVHSYFKCIMYCAGLLFCSVYCQ
jgi:hypothetical protein